MLTPLGTPYRIRQALAREGSAPSLHDCRTAEREARCFHRMGWHAHARQALLIARALWSAHRYHLTQH